MAIANAQVARKALVAVVSSYDTSVVRTTAIENSDEFIAFLNKPVKCGTLNSLDIIGITDDLEKELDISIPDASFNTWRDYFDHLKVKLN